MVRVARALTDTGLHAGEHRLHRTHPRAPTRASAFTRLASEGRRRHAEVRQRLKLNSESLF